MRKNILILKFWIFNLFYFYKPVFLSLEYVDLVIDKKAFFLISWSIQNAYVIHIPELKFQSFKKQGSAYIGVPQLVDEINIKISNSWYTRLVPIKLIRTEMSDQTDFNLKLNCNALNKKSVLIPQIQIQKRQPKINHLKFELKNINAPIIKNLNYSQK